MVKILKVQYKQVGIIVQAWMWLMLW